MNLRTFLCMSAMLSLSQYALAERVDLQKALRTVRQIAPEFAHLFSEMNKHAGSRIQLDAAYDPKFTFVSSHTHDKTGSLNPLSSRSDFDSAELGFELLSTYGPKFRLGLEYERETAELKGMLSPAPEGRRPEITSRSGIKFELSQSLWRNRANKEISLQRAILKGADLGARQKIDLKRQEIQGETEFLFIQLSALREKRRLIMEMQALSEKFVRLIQEEARFGRADSLDVAEAKGRKVALEGRVLSIRMSLKRLEQQISYRLDPEHYLKNTKNSYQHPSIYRTMISLPKTNLPSLYEFALQNRSDLRLLKELRGPLKNRLELAHEQDKPNLDLFASALLGDQDSQIKGSFVGAKTPKYSVGLSLSVQFSHSKLKGQKFEIAHEIAALNQKEHLSQYELYQALDLSWLDLDAAQQSYLQSKSQVLSLSNSLRMEQDKIKQARSDEIASIRFQMDILSAKIEGIEALKHAREAEASLRLICHAYPKEG